MDGRNLTAQDAGVIAVEQFGAPADIQTYRWIRADEDGRTFDPVRLPDSDVTIRLEHACASGGGTLRVGWDLEHRLAAYAWEPGTRAEQAPG